jgi:hypothetical protein
MADRDDDFRGYGHDTGRYSERGYDENERLRGGGGGRGGDRWQASRGRDQERGSSRDHDRDNDRGFFERAGAEVRSWFEDDDDHRGRDRGQDRYRDQEQNRAFGSNAGQWRGGREDRWGENQRGGMGGSVRDQDRYRGHQDAGRQPWGGGDRGEEYSTGRYGSGGGAMGGSSDYRGDRDFAGDRGSDRARGLNRGYGAGGGDDHYHEWRNQQISALDRDYDEYRNESRQKFHSEFGSWREKRQQQRQHLGKATAHMEVVGSDGQHIGTVDKVAGDRIILTRNDPNAGGHHHSIPCGWIQSVDEKVTIDKTAEEAMRQWRDEENRRALFEPEENRSNDGPHILDRSFSGTYDRGDKR